MSITNKAYYGDGVKSLYTNAVLWSEPEFSVLEILIDGLVETGFTRVGAPNPLGFTNEGVDIQFTVAPDEGAHIVIHRVIPIGPYAAFGDGVTLTQEDLTTDQGQQFDLIENHQSDEAVNTAHLGAVLGPINWTLEKTVKEQLEDLVTQDVAHDVELQALRDKDQDLQDQIDGANSAAALTKAAITVTITNQGRYNQSDIIPIGTSLEQIITDMLQKDTPPVFTLSGSGPKLVESGTNLTPLLTGSFTANDAGPSNSYALRRLGITIHSNATPDAFADAPFTIVDESVTYDATVTYDAGIVPAGNINSNVIKYEGARNAFYQAGGDILDVRLNTETSLKPSNGTNLSLNGDSSSTRLVWCYPASLRDPIKLEHNDGSGGIYDLTGSIVMETQQNANDLSGANPIAYKIVTFTSALPFNPIDTITLTI